MTDKTIEEQLGEAFDEHTDVDQDPADVVEEQVIEEPAPQEPEAVVEEPVAEEKPTIDPPQAWTADSKKTGQTFLLTFRQKLSSAKTTLIRCLPPAKVNYALVVR